MPDVRKVCDGMNMPPEAVSFDEDSLTVSLSVAGLLTSTPDLTRHNAIAA